MKLLKNSIEYIVAIFYRYYNRGPTKDIAFLSSTTAVAFLLMLTMFLIIEISELNYESISPIISDRGKIIGLITSLITFLPFYFLVRLGVTKKSVIAYKVSKGQYKRSLSLIFGYIVTVIVLLVAVIESKP